jgi:putative holliday junction resolvase
MRYLAIDYGGKRTGLALCDKAEMMASPVAVVENRALLIQTIVDIVKEEEVEAIGLGLPLNMDDSEGAAVKGVRAFAKDLAGRIDIPIIFHDERLSSSKQRRNLRPPILRERKKRNALMPLPRQGYCNPFWTRSMKAGDYEVTFRSNSLIRLQ